MAKATARPSIVRSPSELRQLLRWQSVGPRIKHCLTSALADYKAHIDRWIGAHVGAALKCLANLPISDGSRKIMSSPTGKSSRRLRPLSTAGEPATGSVKADISGAGWSLTRSNNGQLLRALSRSAKDCHRVCYTNAREASFMPQAGVLGIAAQLLLTRTPPEASDRLRLDCYRIPSFEGRPF